MSRPILLSLSAILSASGTIFATPGSARSNGSASPSYDTAAVAQFQTATGPDIVPRDAAARQTWAEALAFDAAIYGTASVLQYRQMYAQAVDKTNFDYTGFDVFRHERTLAGPGYRPFKTPNADTLYSNAWLDLSGGPVLLEVPATGTRYYTLNFFDAFGNATNISTRTHGNRGGRFLIAPASWTGEIPPGTELFRVATPYMWILMRLLVSGAGDTRRANALQDLFRLTPLSGSVSTSATFPDPGTDSASSFFRALDFVLRANGHPRYEDALVDRFALIGIASSTPIETATADPAIRAGVEEGFSKARRVIEQSVAQGGGNAIGWRHQADLGRFGTSYLLRAAVNTLGTGANVSDENYAFTTFVDGSGTALDGSMADYRLLVEPLPPARFFWSVTVYDARTRELHPNPISRYVIGDRSPGLTHTPGGGVSIIFSSTQPKDGATSNWLPIPKAPFYVTLRVQGPIPGQLEGVWKPKAIDRLDRPAQ